MDNYKKNLQSKIGCIISQMEEGITTDNQPTDNTPFEIDSTQLRSYISLINRDNQSKSELKALEKKHLPKLEEYKEHLKKMKGRKNYAKANKSVIFMHMKEDTMNNGQTKLGYNLQISTANHYILNYGLYPVSTNTITLKAFLGLGYTRFGVMPKRFVQMQITAVKKITTFGKEIRSRLISRTITSIRNKRKSLERTFSV